MAVRTYTRNNDEVLGVDASENLGVARLALHGFLSDLHGGDNCREK